MSEIKVGDLVMVVKPNGCTCDGKSRSCGAIHTVKSIVMDTRHYCMHCKKPFLGLVNMARFEDGAGASLCRLIRIDPPSDEMKRETQKELENV